MNFVENPDEGKETGVWSNRLRNRPKKKELKVRGKSKTVVKSPVPARKRSPSRSNDLKRKVKKVSKDLGFNNNSISVGEIMDKEKKSKTEKLISSSGNEARKCGNREMR